MIFKPNKNKEISLIATSRRYLLIPIIVLVITIVIASLLLVFYTLTGQIGFIIALIPTVVVLAAFYVVFVVYMTKLVTKTYFNELYNTTYQNLKKLNRDEVDLNEYSQTRFVEIKELNNLTSLIRDKYSNGRLIAKEPSYESLSLMFLDKEHTLVSYDSFRNNIGNIIYISQCFRNALVEVYYDLKKNSLSDENKKEILKLYKETFKDNVNPLFSFSSANNSLLIYLPVMDSLRRIKEQLIQTLEYASISVKTIKGIEIAHPRFNIVVYPYSSEEYIFSDLDYVRRLKNVFNIYLPNRARTNLDAHPVITTAMNLNYMSKSLELVSALKSSNINELDIKTLKEIFTNVTNYLGVEHAGIIQKDQATFAYKLLFATDSTTIFDEKSVFPESFINAFDKGVDDDNTLYFSNRNSMTIALGRELDYYDVSSGFFQVIRDDKGGVDSILFLINTGDRKLYIDTYIRETLFVIALNISDYLARIKMMNYIDLKNLEAEHILSLDNKHSLYRVDDSSNITYMSQYMHKLFPHAKVGGKCYKELFGLDKMCPDCPMKQFKKKEVMIHNEPYNISLTLNDRKTHERALLLTYLEKAGTKSDYFDNNLLCYSNYALTQLLRDEYEHNARGYILLLCLDNYEDFLTSQGSEGFGFATRSLIRNIKNKLKITDVYLYNASTIAIHFPSIGHIDIMTKCEQIYEISKEHYLDDGSNDQFVMTYLPVGYPRGYADANDFMKHMSDVVHSEKYPHGRDFIYFANYPIERSASKREHIKEIINKEFYGLSPQSLVLQPFVTASDEKIFGAEVLLRITDFYSNAILNANEVTRIARQENMTHILTESIVNFISNLYAEYGNGILRKNKFSRFAINVDNTYFDDFKFIETIADIMKVNNLPKYCMSFEVPEDIIAENLSKIKAFSKKLEESNIYLSCDRFKDNIISIERLHELNFNEVKIARDLIIDIEKDVNKVHTIRKIVSECKKYGLRAACVGVENEAQFRILKSIDPDMLVQGYYVYKPLTRGDFIAALNKFE